MRKSEIVSFDEVDEIKWDLEKIASEWSLKFVNLAQEKEKLYHEMEEEISSINKEKAKEVNDIQ